MQINTRIELGEQTIRNYNWGLLNSAIIKRQPCGSVGQEQVNGSRFRARLKRRDSGGDQNGINYASSTGRTTVWDTSVQKDIVTRESAYRTVIIGGGTKPESSLVKELNIYTMRKKRPYRVLNNIVERLTAPITSPCPPGPQQDADLVLILYHCSISFLRSSGHRLDWPAQAAVARA